jgi:hypothetical protein
VGRRDLIKTESATVGEPVRPNEAYILAEQDKFQFHQWALDLVGARAVEQKKSSDYRIDGKILFPGDPKASKAERIILQVKGGKTGVKGMRDLRGVLDREKAATGVLMFLKPPMCDMVAETVSAGFLGHKAIQVLTHCTTGICVFRKGRRKRQNAERPGKTHPKPPQSHINATSKPPQSVLIARR